MGENPMMEKRGQKNVKINFCRIFIEKQIF